MASVLRRYLDAASHKATRRAADKIIETGVGDPMGEASRVVGRAIGGPIAAGIEGVARGAGKAVKGVAKGTADLAGGLTRKAMPYSWQDALGKRGLMRPLEIDMGNPRMRAYHSKRHGIPLTPAEEKALKLRWPGYLATGAFVGVPSVLLAQHGNRDVYDNLSNAANYGVREVTASDKRMRSYLAAAMEKTAAGPAGGGGSLGQGTGSHPLMNIGSELVGKGVGAFAGEALKPSAAGLGYALQKQLFPNVMDRIGAPDALAESAVKEFGKQTGTMASNLVQGVVGGGMDAGREAMSWGPKRKQIYERLMATDPVISRADPEMVLQAYHTMKRFAPLLSTDPATVQSFLREAVVHDGALNYNTIGALAKAESEARHALGM